MSESKPEDVPYRIRASAYSMSYDLTMEDLAKLIAPYLAKLLYEKSRMTD